jgi:hypothetical protein
MRTKLRPRNGSRPSRVAVWLCAAPFLTMAAMAAPPTAAQAAKAPDGIYTCVDEKGRRLTADRPIAECTGKEQRVLNKDGSLKLVHPPTLTAEERADKEVRDRKAAEGRAAQADAVRRDRNLTQRYPNEDVHNKAREAALDTVRLAIKASDARLKILAGERKPLLDEAEFFKGRTMPLKLRQALDANDASYEAQRSAMANQEVELVRINRLYDAELERLRRLWAGAPHGSLGTLAASPADAASAAR